MSMEERPRVLVVDTQPIDPPVGGGRIRLLGLYHALGLPTLYLGSYDWYDAPYRSHRLSPDLTEINIPLGRAHLNLGAEWTTFGGLPTVMDTAFPLMAPLSPELGQAARVAVRRSDIVVVSHPWAFPLVREALAPAQLLVYDAHNVEGLLRAQLLDDGGFGTELVKHVLTTEYELAHRADLLVACSRGDCQLFGELYGVPEKKTCEVPNGVFARQIVPPTPAAKRDAKEHLRHASSSAIFLGSAYEPNIEAVEFICARLAPVLPAITFLLCGGVTEAVPLARWRSRRPLNVRFVGPVSEEKKLQCLWAADMAINPMFAGSGTNIKMFDYLAAGLPVVTTAVGARGIDTGAEQILITAEADAFAGALRQLAEDPDHARALAAQGRQLVEQRYAWENISPNLGALLRQALAEKRAAWLGSGRTAA